MASTVDSKTALTAMVSVLTAYTSAVGVSTATFNTSLASQQTADTSLSSAESKILTQISSAIGSAQPSSSIHNSAFGTGVDFRTLYTAMASAITAFSSASSVTTGNFATQLSSMITIDTGLTSVECGLVTLLTSAVGNATPAASTHSQV
jgi:hypothetical protein